MSKLWDFLAGGAGKLVESIGGVVDEFHLSKEEKEQFKLEVQKLVLMDRQMTEQTIQAEMQAKTSIMKAELEQGDKYTKRARPTVIYAGIAFILLVEVLFPMGYWTAAGIAWFNGTELTDFPVQPDMDLPTEFWWAFTTAFSVYAIGRTAEKRGVSNAFTDAAHVIGSGTLPGK